MNRPLSLGTIILMLVVLSAPDALAQRRGKPAKNPVGLAFVGGEKGGRLGTVKPTTQRRTFTLVNRGADTVTLHAIEDSCNCITSRPERTVMLPGDTLRFEVTLPMQNRVGKFSDSIIVSSTDRRSPRLVLPITAVVFRPVTVTPQSGIVYDEGGRDSVRKVTFEIRNTGREKVRLLPPAVTSVHGMNLDFSLDSAVWLRPGKSVLIEALVKLHDDNAYAETHIRTSSAAMPVVPIPFFSRKKR